MAEHEVYLTVTEYRVAIMPEACVRHPRSELRHWCLSVALADGGWMVADGHQVLGKDGAWSYERRFADDDGAWLAVNVHQSVEGALAAAREFAPKVTINGLTAVEALARHRARNLECCRG